MPQFTKYILFFLCITNSLISVAQDPDSIGEEYTLGTGIEDVTRLVNGSLPHNVGTYGYANYSNPIDTTINRPEDGIINGVHLPIKSRVLVLTHTVSRSELIYVLLDLAFTSDNIRRELLKKIHHYKPEFQSSHLILTATHTHSAPGGFSDYMGYEVATPGYRPDIVETIVEGTFKAILTAWNNAIPVSLEFNEKVVPDHIPIAYSRRALPAYNSNPEVKSAISAAENYKATDRLWQLIAFRSENQLYSLLNFFGAHPNRMGSNIISSDTRGSASDQLELDLPGQGIALFAQNAPGDIDSEGSYRKAAERTDTMILSPAYYPRDSTGEIVKVARGKRVRIEGKILMDQALSTLSEPDTAFRITGGLDCELIYVNMAGQYAPKGKYPSTLDPMDYYTNDFYLLGGFGKFGSLFRPQLRLTYTTSPTIGLGAIARFDDRLVKLMTNLERFVRYNRLVFSGFDSEGFDNMKYVWQMYRGQAQKTVMLEGGPISSALGFRIGGGMFNAFSGVDPVLLELARGKESGLHEEHTFYPTVMPMQIIIIGNLAIIGVSGEPGNIAGQRIERTVLSVLKDRGIERAIVNGYSNENTGYIFTPEEYEHQYTPSQCGFVLYGRWTCPVVRYNFEKIARAMLLPKADRSSILDHTVKPPEFSEQWYENASYLEFLQPVPTHKEKKKVRKSK